MKECSICGREYPDKKRFTKLAGVGWMGCLGTMDLVGPCCRRRRRKWKGTLRKRTEQERKRLKRIRTEGYKPISKDIVNTVKLLNKMEKESSGYWRKC